MKRVVYFLALSAIILSCGKVPEQTEQEVVVVPPDNVVPPDYIESGIKLGQGIPVLGNWDCNQQTPNTVLFWAPVNCGYEESGTVNSDSDHRLGKLYQWGAGDSNLPYKYKEEPVVAREMYYDTPTPSPWYSLMTITGTSSDRWNGNQGPCPDGWRLPTSYEFIVLCAGKNGSYGWVYNGTYAGQANTYPGAEFFGANSNKSVGKGVFFPAAGKRSGDGSSDNRNLYGYYWSADPQYNEEALSLWFGSSTLNDITSPRPYRAIARSVRCVSGEGDQHVKVIARAVLTTSSVREITSSSAICGGRITSEGDAHVTECGVWYSTNPLPTISDTKVEATSNGLGEYTCNLTGLSEKTTYYVRAYAVNAYGTYYGNVETFTTLDDYDDSTPDYIENGTNLGKGIAILGDWNEDGNQTTLYWAPVNCGYEEVGKQ